MFCCVSQFISAAKSVSLGTEAIPECPRRETFVNCLMQRFRSAFSRSSSRFASHQRSSGPSSPQTASVGIAGGATAVDDDELLVNVLDGVSSDQQCDWSQAVDAPRTSLGFPDAMFSLPWVMTHSFHEPFFAAMLLSRTRQLVAGPIDQRIDSVALQEIPVLSWRLFQLELSLLCVAASVGRTVGSSQQTGAALLRGCRLNAGCINQSSSSTGTSSAGMASGTRLIFAAANLCYERVATTDSDCRCCPAGGSPCTMVRDAIPALHLRVTSAARLPSPGLSLLRCSCTCPDVVPSTHRNSLRLPHDACLAVTVGIYNRHAARRQLCLDCWVRHWRLWLAAWETGTSA